MVGDTRGARVTRRLRALGWGRVWDATRGRSVQRYEGERWGLDNGAFGAWRRGEEWDGGAFLEGVDRCLETAGALPMWGALPDVVADWPKTLTRAGRWLAKLPPDVPWYLVLQDGARPADVAPFASRLRGVFLGGTDAFKARAREWCEWAIDAGLGFHYGRASTRSRIVTAHRIGATSMDSTQGTWSREGWRRFAASVELARHQQDFFVEAS